jgi:hypothetical protein
MPTSDQLIGQHHVTHAERAVGAHVAQRRRGDPAGARVELAGEQLRCHVGLAVWCELDAAVAAPVGHGGEVVCERLGAQHANRADGTTTAVEQLGCLRADLGRGVAPPRRRQALEAPVDGLVGQGGYRRRADRSGHVFI